MSYRVEIAPPARRAIASWQLPDAVLVEVYLRLREALCDYPALSLERTRQPYDGMTFGFSMIDPENRLCVHTFAFQILYSQDEARLIVARGGYERTVGI